tara:strand:- start:3154 stop:4107 length:954 start_codon:yes stop_codon:yes gene_type:complete
MNLIPSFMPQMPSWNNNVRLAGLNDEQLKALAMTSGVNFQMLKAQQRAEVASAGSVGNFEETVVPTVEVSLITNAKNPKKARRKNLKMLRRALRPPNYNLGLYRIYRYNAAFECACCGVDVRRFLEGDNDYAQIVDYDINLSLADLYWFDETTKEAIKPHARTRGDHGDQMNSTLCPAHLHIFHTLKKMVQEDQMSDDGFKPVSKGTKFLKVPGLSTLTAGMVGNNNNRSTTESLKKYEPFFSLIQQDAKHKKGITLTQYPNPITGISDLVTVTFDLRALQIEDAMAQRNMIGLAGQQMQQQSIPPVANQAEGLQTQ